MNKPSRKVPALIEPLEHNRVTQAILDFVSDVPTSKVSSSSHPDAEAQRLGKRAAQRAALTAGSLALPPGPLGWLTLLPELTLIWKIQGQMVSDIAAAYGRHATLGREQMLWCLFRHTAAQAFRDLVVRMGDRLVFRRMSHGIAQRVARQVGATLTQRAIGEGISRWLPVVGALGVGAYAYYDTGQVAKTAIALFSGEMDFIDGPAFDGSGVDFPCVGSSGIDSSGVDSSGVDSPAIDRPAFAEPGADSGAGAAAAAASKAVRKTAVSAAGTAVKKAVKKVTRRAVDRALAGAARKITSTAEKVGSAAKKRAAARPPKPNDHQT